MTADQFLTSHRIFTRQELAAALRARGVTASTVSSHLSRWVRLQRITPVKRGLFVRNDDASTGRGPAPDYLALASRMAPDAALAYHTALEAHGLAQSAFERLTFATWTSTRALEFQGRSFVPVRPRAPLRHADRGERWIERRDRAGMEVRVTTIERTVVDVLDRFDLAGGPHEAWRSLAAVRALDPVDLEAYVRTLGSATLAAKAGYYLESRQEDLVIPAPTLERLEAASPRVPVYMDRALRGRVVRRWSLIVPEDLLRGDEDRT